MLLILALGTDLYTVKHRLDKSVNVGSIPTTPTFKFKTNKNTTMAKKKSKQNVNPFNIESKANVIGVVEDESYLMGIGNMQSFEDHLGVTNTPTFEEVVHPDHYNQLPNGIECWDVTEHFPANVGMGIKHLWRAGKKPGQNDIKDYKKAIQYFERQIKLLQGVNKRMK